MNRTIFLFDGSFDGLLNSVARAVKSRKPATHIYCQKTYIPQLFDEVISLPTDFEQAQRLISYFNTLHSRIVHLAMDGFLSEDPETANHLYHFTLLSLRHGKQVLHLHTDDCVRQLHALSKKVRFETHRLTGLIRFRILKEEIQYGPFESDHNVLLPLARHFTKRLHNRKWVLHDAGRNIALYWDTNDIQPADIDPAFAAQVRTTGEVSATDLKDDEIYYQRLWQNFHTAINNKSRRNTRLQRQLMPARYWKYLPEMQQYKT